MENAVDRLTANYRKEELFLTKSGRHLPVRAAIINIVKEMRSVIFPGYFDIDSGAAVFPEHYTGYLLNYLFDRMQAQIETAFLYIGSQTLYCILYGCLFVTHNWSPRILLSFHIITLFFLRQ